GSAPSSAKRLLTSGSCNIRLISAFNLFTISLGVPLGTISPNQPFPSKPGKPDSATVGTSGNSGDRFDPVTASAFSEPVLIRGSTKGNGAKFNWVNPAAKSLIAGPLPL